MIAILSAFLRVLVFYLAGLLLVLGGVFLARCVVVVWQVMEGSIASRREWAPWRLLRVLFLSASLLLLSAFWCWLVAMRYL